MTPILIGSLAFAQTAPDADTPPPPPPGTRITIPPPPPQQPNNNNNAPSSGPTINNNNNNNNTNTVSPTITANPVNNNSNTSNNTNTNDNKSNAAATATNNNTIYIYPPAVPPPAPPPVTALTPPPLVPPPLVPPPAYGRPVYAPPPFYRRPVRLNCARLCGQPPPPVLIPSPVKERIRYLSFGAHVTALGMAHQPLAGWGTLYGGGFQITVRSRGRFGFEMAQDFLRGQLKAGDGASLTRNSFPVDFSFRGYILPNRDRYHFNMYLGGGFGAMLSSVETPQLALNDFGSNNSQTFLEWTLHADVGAEMRFKWIALGLDARVLGLFRDHNFADGRFYGDVQDGLVPNRTWGLQGRGYLSFWF